VFLATSGVFKKYLKIRLKTMEMFYFKRNEKKSLGRIFIDEIILECFKNLQEHIWAGNVFSRVF
jgi:hypothetical protein